MSWISTWVSWWQSWNILPIFPSHENHGLSLWNIVGMICRQSPSCTQAGPKDLQHLLHSLHKLNHELWTSSTPRFLPYHHHLLPLPTQISMASLLSLPSLPFPPPSMLPWPSSSWREMGHVTTVAPFIHLDGCSIVQPQTHFRSPRMLQHWCLSGPDNSMVQQRFDGACHLVIVVFALELTAL
jgi:hypothetical protein